MYRHTQYSRTPLLVNGGFALLLLGIGWSDRTILPLMLVCGAGLAWCGWAFRRMSVEVAEGELRAWFGRGWPRYAWPLARIASVRTVTNSHWNGTGIRFTRHGMLYNVAGGPGIEFRLRSGATFRLGSDDAAGLASAIAGGTRLPAHAETHAPLPQPRHRR